MLLSDLSIPECVKSGHIIIDPYKPENVNTSSYDVTLGEYYYREQKPESLAFYNIYDRDHVNKVWGEYQRAEQLGNMCLSNIDSTDRVIWIYPHETLLCHTEEFIGGVVNMTTKMQARSSFGRNFIEVCKCAGFGDIGYFNRWTMEVTNNSQHYPIILVVGRRIAQIIFMETHPSEAHFSYEKAGKYQKTDSLEKLKASWHPSMMLPRLYHDRECSGLISRAV